MSNSLTKGNKILKDLERRLDQVDDDTDMRLYPPIALGLEQYKGDNEYFSEKVKNSLIDTEQHYGLKNIWIDNDGLLARYASCKQTSCIGFISRSDSSSHVLMVLGESFEKEVFIKKLKEEIDVKR